MHALLSFLLFFIFDCFSYDALAELNNGKEFDRPSNSIGDQWRAECDMGEVDSGVLA
jgi:hypothetical protein